MAKLAKRTESGAGMIKGVHHVALAAKSPDDLAAYHQSVFGLSRPKTALDPQVWKGHLVADYDGEAQLWAADNAYIAIVPRGDCGAADDAAPPSLNQLGLRHICFQNRDITALAQQIATAGGSLFADPVDLGTGNQYAYARDPEGNIYEIEGLPYADQTANPWIAHAAIVVPDLDQAIHFYQGLLGGELRHRLRIGPGEKSDRMSGFKGAILEGAWLYAGNTLIELWQFIHPASPRCEGDVRGLGSGFAHIALETTDALAAGHRVIDLGGAVTLEAVTDGGVTCVTAKDPQGVVIKLVEFDDRALGWSIDRLSDPYICARVDNWGPTASRPFAGVV